MVTLLKDKNMSFTMEKLKISKHHVFSMPVNEFESRRKEKEK